MYITIQIRITKICQFQEYLSSIIFLARNKEHLKFGITHGNTSIYSTISHSAIGEIETKRKYMKVTPMPQGKPGPILAQTTENTQSHLKTEKPEKTNLIRISKTEKKIR